MYIYFFFILYIIFRWQVLKFKIALKRRYYKVFRLPHLNNSHFKIKLLSWIFEIIAYGHILYLLILLLYASYLRNEIFSITLSFGSFILIKLWKKNNLIMFTSYLQKKKEHEVFLVHFILFIYFLIISKQSFL